MVTQCPSSIDIVVLNREVDATTIERCMVFSSKSSLHQSYTDEAAILTTKKKNSGLWAAFDAQDIASEVEAEYTGVVDGLLGSRNQGVIRKVSWLAEWLPNANNWDRSDSSLEFAWSYQVWPIKYYRDLTTTWRGVGPGQTNRVAFSPASWWPSQRPSW